MLASMNVAHICIIYINAGVGEQASFLQAFPGEKGLLLRPKTGKHEPCQLCLAYISAGSNRDAHTHAHTIYHDYSAAQVIGTKPKTGTHSMGA